MKKLTIDSFISAADDFEKSQYKLLGALKDYSSLLHKNKVYPALSDLIELEEILGGIVKERDQMEKVFPTLVNNKILINNSTGSEEINVTPGNIDQVFEFINWAYPKIQEAVNEGKALYSFVKENLLIEEIGIVPLYKNEGYFFITNHSNNTFNIYRFEIPFIAYESDECPAMKIELVKSYENYEVISGDDHDLKISLAKGNNNLPNPAAFKLECELDFPFEETILPIAKRLLAKKLAA
ncbi:MAG: hypothetical protein C4539_02545 [Ignavibacteriales bacterium]|nr:MAG: hypothetical protein C4539_02545 [Ignavibacteriales bacterium]